MSETEDPRLERYLRDKLGEALPDDPDGRDRVIEALHSAKAPRRPGWLSWWIEPRILALAPVPAVLAAVALVLGGTMLGRGLAPRRPPADVPPAHLEAAAPGDQLVRFAFHAPRAEHVVLVGDFNGWDPQATPMRHGGGDTWTVAVGLPRGRHLYAFVVDGHWAPDPGAPLAPEDDFGMPNSVVLVGESSSI